VSKKAWIIFIAICVVVLGGLVYLSGLNRVDVSGIDTNAILNGSQKSGNIADHVFGKKDSKVTMIEYGDFQCPGCESAYPTMKAISEKYQGQIAFVFRNFPLTDKHPNAKAAAAAAEAAGLQNKYWEMHNKLYEEQSNWENLDTAQRTSAFTGYAQGLGLNVGTFTKDLTSDVVNQKIMFDQALGRKANVDATPTILLNGTLVNQYVNGGKIVDSTASNAQPIWANTTSFDTLLLQPLLKQDNIALPNA
jgi:protein-disulfide isomerase